MDVVNHERNALIYTDEELIFLINEQLPLEARIDPDTFRRWKNSVDIAYIPEISGEGLTWLPLTVQAGAATDNGDGTETVTYRDLLPATDSRRFARVAVASGY